jgi:predicted nucleotidyltransferase
MGKVFSWDEVKEKKIPSIADFTNVVREIRFNLEKAEGVIGGTFFGSTLWNCHNFRSDIDCIVVYDPRRQLEFIEVLWKINRIAADCYVPLEIVPLDLDTVRNSLHSIGPSFAAHLRRAVEKGGVIKENPLPFFAFEGQSDIEDVRGYFCHKLQRLQKGWSLLPVMETAELHRFLQKVIETPIHVARKILWWRNRENREMNDDSKKAVFNSYCKFAGERERKLLEKIIIADRGYTVVLIGQLQELNEDLYFKAIEELKSLVGDVLSFVKFNALMLFG